MLETFGKWLERLRQGRGLSVRQLAVKASISHATVSNIEADKVGASPKMVKALAVALDVEPEEAFRVWAADAAQQQGVDLEYEADPDTINVAVEGLRHLDTSLKTLAAQKAQEAAAGIVESNRLIRSATVENSFGPDRYPESQDAPAARLVDTAEPYIVEIKPSDEPERKTKLGVRQRSPRPTDAHPLPED